MHDDTASIGLQKLGMRFKELRSTLGLSQRLELCMAFSSSASLQAFLVLKSGSANSRLAYYTRKGLVYDYVIAPRIIPLNSATQQPSRIPKSLSPSPSTTNPEINHDGRRILREDG
jgi:hypothetical protein